MWVSFRKRRNRRRNWFDRFRLRILGTVREPLTPREVAHRCIAIAALLLPLVTWEHGQKIIRQFHKARSGMVVAQADQLRSEGQHHEALSLLALHSEKAPADPALLRSLAWSCAGELAVHARGFLMSLAATGNANVEDQLLLASVHVRLEQPRDAAAIYEALVRDHPRNPDVWRAWAAACRSKGEYSEAFKGYQRVLAILPHDLQAASGLAELLLRSEAKKDIDQAAAMLLSQLDRAAGAGLPSASSIANVLLAIPLSSEPLRLRFAALLKKMPDATPEQQVAAIILGQADGTQAVVRREEIRGFLGKNRGLSVDDRRAVAKWLEKNGELPLVLDWISMADAAGDPDLLAQRMEALLSCGLWKEAAELAAHPSAQCIEESCGSQLLQALAVLNEGAQPRNLAAKVLSQALDESATRQHFTACNAVGFAALDHELFDIAAKAFSIAMEKGSAVACPLDEYLTAARHSGSSAADAMKVISARARSVTDAALKKQSIYLSLLCGDHIERAAMDLAELGGSSSRDPYLRFLDAFMRFRFGDFAGAVDKLVPLPKHRWRQGEALVISSVLAAGGKLREAAELSEKVSGKGLFPEELELFRSAQGEPAAPSLLTAISPKAAR